MQDLIREGYEVFAFRGGARSQRYVVDFCYTAEQAKLSTEHHSKSGKKYHYEKCNVVKIDGKWHKVSLKPLPVLVVNKIEEQNIPYYDWWYTYHHKDCGTKFGGCSPNCPKDHYEKTKEWSCVRESDGGYSIRQKVEE